MSTQVSPPRPTVPISQVIQEYCRGLRNNWMTFVILGAVLVVMGIIALSYSVIASVAVAVVLGCCLLVGGAFTIAGAFFNQSWGGFFVSLLSGILELAVGFLILSNPFDAVIVCSLVIAVVFFVEGLFRIVGSIAGQFQHWFIMLLGGIINVLLGVIIWQGMPWTGLTVIGILLGINLIASGVAYVLIGLRARTLPV